MEMLRTPFSRTPALVRLWEKASQGLEQSDNGYESASRRFWRLVSKGTDYDAKLVRKALEAAGYEKLSGNAARAKITWSVAPDPQRLADLATKNPYLAEKLRASAEAAQSGRSPVNLRRLQRTESIKHIIPRNPEMGSELEQKALEYPNCFLDPQNLRFESLYENMLMGNKSVERKTKKGS